jgi:hypothetical protein
MGFATFTLAFVAFSEYRTWHEKYSCELTILKCHLMIVLC